LQRINGIRPRDMDGGRIDDDEWIDVVIPTGSSGDDMRSRCRSWLFEPKRRDLSVPHRVAASFMFPSLVVVFADVVHMDRGVILKLISVTSAT